MYTGHSPGVVLGEPAVAREPADLLLPADEEEVPLGQQDEVVVAVKHSPGIAVDEVLELAEVPLGGHGRQLVLDGVDLLLCCVPQEFKKVIYAAKQNIAT